MKPKKLDNINRENIFSVPDSYFEDLPTRIQSKVNQSPKEFVFFRGLRLFSLRYALPAIALLVGVWFFMPKETDIAPASMPATENLLSDISLEEIESYVSENDFSVTEIIDLAHENEVSIQFSQDKTEEEEFFEIDIDLVDLEEML